MERGMEDFLLEPGTERLVTPEERERIDRILGSMGLYNAANDGTIDTTQQHETDNQWRVAQ